MVLYQIMIEQEEEKQFKSIMKDYQIQVGWLNSLIADPAGEHYFYKKTPTERLGNYERVIERTTAFLDFLGNPQDKYPSIHIAGTGGKGSVTVMIGSILQVAGFKTGVYTSPYLQIPNEKWIINGKMISPSYFSCAVDCLRGKYESFVKSNSHLRPTYGEAQVGLTHQLFSQEHVDFGVIETGMGGRYDPTNVLHPEISVITNVDFDHVDQLGPSLKDIARHKAGIIKANIPVVTGVYAEETLKVLKEEAENKKAPLFQLGKEFSYHLRRFNEGGSLIDIHTPNNSFKGIKVSLPGLFQAENAAIAVMACEIVLSRKGINLTSETLNLAFSHLHFPGRMEKMQENPTVIIDGAHNPQKMKALAESMKKLYPDKKYILVIGMLATKDAREASKFVVSQASQVITSSPHVIGKPSISSEGMAKIIKSIKPELKVTPCLDVREAIELARSSVKKDELILITGSLYLLGEARELWYPKKEILFQAEANT